MNGCGAFVDPEALVGNRKRANGSGKNTDGNIVGLFFHRTISISY
jgi:hypothetical protein